MRIAYVPAVDLASENALVGAALALGAGRLQVVALAERTGFRPDDHLGARPRRAAELDRGDAALGNTGYRLSRVARSWHVDAEAWDDLLRHPMATEMIVGATQAEPGFFPDGFGISPRTEPRNEYLGLITTWPEPNTFVLGLNYYDNADGHDNEDMYKLDLTTFEMTPYMRGAFVKEYPQYAEYHWAEKPFLRELRDR